MLAFLWVPLCTEDLHDAGLLAGGHHPASRVEGGRDVVCSKERDTTEAEETWTD